MSIKDEKFFKYFYAYWSSLIKNWQKILNYLQIYIFYKDELSLSRCVHYYEKILKNNNQAISAFVELLNTSSYIKNKISLNLCEKNS